ncbi:Bro-N domain-containing protein [Sulfitobacter sp. M21595]|uniref:BRO-N domain-containing protein n=1 Tax=Sulfitobacter sp. M21595 TaxID=3368574 RepID=UPI0037460C5B
MRVVLDEDGCPWWVARDVCAAIGILNHRDTVTGLGEDERESVLVDTLGGPQAMVCVNEPGLYRLIFSSRKPAAETFKRWLAHEVLPTLRRTGRYDMTEGTASDAEPPASAEYWLGVVREARLTYGRAAAARVWAQSPLPPAGDGAESLGEFAHLFIEFLKDRCQVTGNSRDFIRSRRLADVFKAYCDARGLTWPGDRSVANTMLRVAHVYQDPETGNRMWPIKRSDTGYAGLAFVRTRESCA